MTALPRKHPTGGQKLKKSNRVYPRYDTAEERLEKKQIGQQGISSQGQPQNAQPQRGWTAQPAQQPQQNPQPPVKNGLNILVWIIIIIILAMLFYNIVTYIVIGPNTDRDDGYTPAGNDCTCYCDDGITQCNSNSQCPPDTSVPGTSVPGVCGCPVGC